jgi:hypothetical protein
MVRRPVFDNPTKRAWWQVHVEAQPQSGMTAAIEEAAEPREKLTRRRFTIEQKIAILLEVEQPGETMSSISRAHGLSTSLLFRWRDIYGVGKEKPTMLMPIEIVEDGDPDTRLPAMFSNLMVCPPGMKAIDLADGRRVLAPIDADPDAVRATVTERKAQP